MDTRSPERGLSTATYGLMLLNTAVFFLIPLLSNINLAVTQYGFYPPDFLSGELSRAITSGFIHLDVGHLFWNLFFLWVFGRVVEEEYGGWWMLVIYFTGLVMGNFATMLAFPDIRVVGASGAVFAVISAAILLEPMRPMFGAWMLPVALVGVLYIAPSFLNMFSLSNQVSNISHVGGALGGTSIALARDWERSKEGLWAVLTLVVLIVGLGFF